MRRNGDTLVLTSGREFYANGGMLSLSDKLVMCEGYDGSISEERADPDDDDPKPWTAEERAEIAAYMVDLWTRWGQK